MADEVAPPFPYFPSSEFKFHIQDILQDNVPGYTYAPIHGESTDISTINYNPVWEGNIAYNYIPTAQVLKISSTDTRDTANGTGVRRILIKGLDVDFNLIQEEVTLQGNTAVNTTKQYLRVHSMAGSTFGSNNANHGTIYIGIGTTTSGVNTIPVCIIASSKKFSQMAVYTVPKGYALITYAYNFAASATKEINVRVFVHPNVLTSSVSILSNQIITLESQPVTFYEESDIEWQAISTSGNTAAGIDIQAILVKNEFL